MEQGNTVSLVTKAVIINQISQYYLTTFVCSLNAIKYNSKRKILSFSLISILFLLLGAYVNYNAGEENFF